MFKKKLRKILKFYDIKDVVTLSSGVLIAQLIGIVCQPIITRLYGPENLGLFAVIISIVAMFEPVLTLQYDVCVVSACDDDEADTIAALSLYVGLILSIAIYIGLVVYSILIPHAFNDLGKWIYIVIFLFVFTVISAVATKYNIRHQQYSLISTVSVASTSVSNAVKISLGLIGIGFWGLIISYFLSVLIGLKVKCQYILDNYEKVLFKRPNELLQCAVKYKKQPIFSMPGTFIVSFSYSVIALLIVHFYGLKEVGFYSLSVMMLGLPLTLMSQNISMVFFKNASVEFTESHSIRQSLKKCSSLLLVIAIPTFITIWLLAEFGIALIFGNEWFRSGTFVKLLIPLYLARFLASGIATGLVIIEEQSMKLVIQTFFVISALVAAYVSFKLALPIEKFLSIISYSYASVYVAISLFLFKKA